MRRGSSPALDNAMAITIFRAASSPADYEQAEFFATRACDSHPNPIPPELPTTLGNILSLRGKHQPAIAAFERALRSHPDHFNARLGLANTLRQVHRLSDAVAILEQALHSAPADPVSHAALLATLAASVLWIGDAERAWTIISDAISRFPDDPLVASTFANTACYVPDLTREQEHDAQRRYGLLYDRLVRITPPPPAAPKPAGAKIRIGLVSPDFRQHSVAYFIEPLLNNLDKNAFEVFGYSTSTQSDATTKRLATLFPTFRTIGSLSDHDAAVQVRRDAIDVLIDLAGHTLGHRLPLFLFRAAPKQAAYLGYPSITGLSTIDARFVDALTDPEGCDNTASPEALVRLSAPFLTYTPPPEAPAIAVPDPTPFTFGSFNATPKMNNHTLTVWSKILRAAPGSRLLLKSTQFSDPQIRATFLARFAALGAAPGQVEILPATASLAEHLSLYNRIHLALDTFPYCGATTTCEAAFMGVPTLTLAPESHGKRHVSRVGLTINTALGLSDLVAGTPEAYVERAVAASTGALPLPDRRELRDRVVRTSPLADGARLADSFGHAIRTLVSTPA